MEWNTKLLNEEFMYDFYITVLYFRLLQHLLFFIPLYLFHFFLCATTFIWKKGSEDRVS